MKAFIFVYWFVIALCTLGWVMNLVKLCHMSFDVITGFCVVRIIGVFLPFVGAVTGFISN